MNHTPSPSPQWYISPAHQWVRSQRAQRGLTSRPHLLWFGTCQLCWLYCTRLLYRTIPLVPVSRRGWLYFLYCLSFLVNGLFPVCLFVCWLAHQSHATADNVSLLSGKCVFLFIFVSLFWLFGINKLPFEHSYFLSVCFCCLHCWVSQQHCNGLESYLFYSVLNYISTNKCH